MGRAKQFRNRDRGDAGAGQMLVFCAVSLLVLPGAMSFAVDLGDFKEGVLRWESVVGWMESVLPWLQNAATCIACVWVGILPICLIRRTRPLAVACLRYSSIFIGITCWWHSFIVTYRILGWLPVVIGMLFAGLGVIPMALIGTAEKGQWNLFWNLMTAVVLTLLPRFLAAFLANRPGRRPIEDRSTGYCVND